MGWSIGNVILDFSGGFFSLLQLVIEAVGNGRPIIGGGAFNALKFTLSIVSMFYNVIFLIQHYVLYPPHKKSTGKLDINSPVSSHGGSTIIVKTTMTEDNDTSKDNLLVNK